MMTMPIKQGVVLNGKKILKPDEILPFVKLFIPI